MVFKNINISQFSCDWGVASRDVSLRVRNMLYNESERVVSSAVRLVLRSRRSLSRAHYSAYTIIGNDSQQRTSKVLSTNVAESIKTMRFMLSNNYFFIFSIY